MYPQSAVSSCIQQFFHLIFILWQWDVQRQCGSCLSTGSRCHTTPGISRKVTLLEQIGPFFFQQTCGSTDAGEFQGVLLWLAGPHSARGLHSGAHCSTQISLYREPHQRERESSYDPVVIKSWLTNTRLGICLFKGKYRIARR